MRKAGNRGISEGAPAPGNKRCARTLPNGSTGNCRFTSACRTALKTNAPQPVRLKRTEFGTLPPGSFKRAKPGAHAIPVDEVRAGAPVGETQHDDGLADARLDAGPFADAGFTLSAGLADVSLPRIRSSSACLHM